MLKLQYIITLLCLAPAVVQAADNSHNNGYHNNGHSTGYHQFRSMQRTKIHEDYNQINSERTGLQNSYRTLDNDRRHGNPSEVAADRAQISSLREQLQSAKLDLRQDQMYTYAHRNDYGDTNGWGSNFHDNGNHHYHGWND